MNIKKIAPFAAMAAGAVLALANSAFKESPHNKSGQMLYTFQYNPPNDTGYSASSVHEVSNWSYSEDADACSGDDVEACTIQVPASFVDNPTGDPTLNSSINIGTASTLSGVYYVSSTAAGGNGTISNRAE